MPINKKQRCPISIYKSLGASLSNKKVKENLSSYYFPGSDSDDFCHLLVAFAKLFGPRLGPRPGLEVIKLEYRLKLKIKHNDWLLADTCPQAANHCALF